MAETNGLSRASDNTFQLASCSVGVIISLPLTLNRNASTKNPWRTENLPFAQFFAVPLDTNKTFQRKYLETKFCNSVTSQEIRSAVMYDWLI